MGNRFVMVPAAEAGRDARVRRRRDEERRHRSDFDWASGPVPEHEKINVDAAKRAEGAIDALLRRTLSK